jgi:hypothetical protein
LPSAATAVVGLASHRAPGETICKMAGSRELDDDLDDEEQDDLDDEEQDDLDDEEQDEGEDEPQSDRLDVELAAFHDYEYRRYTPLAVLGAVIVAGMWILSAGATEERKIIPLAKPRTEQPGPPRDIREARRRSRPKAEAPSEAAAEPTPPARPAAAPDPLWADHESGARRRQQAEPGDAPTEGAGAEEDLVEAMKRAIARQKEAALREK